MNTPEHEYLRDPILRIKKYAILAKALVHLGRYKDAADVCAEAMTFGNGSPNSQSSQLDLSEIKEIVEDLRLKQQAEIEILRKAGPHKASVISTCFSSMYFLAIDFWTYQILGLPTTASKTDIKRAYKSQSLAHHPDKPAGNAERFKLISEAYQTLMATPPTARPFASRYR